MAFTQFKLIDFTSKLMPWNWVFFYLFLYLYSGGFINFYLINQIELVLKMKILLGLALAHSITFAYIIFYKFIDVIYS